MPAIRPRSHPAILLTSGGFIGTWIADYALRAGYRVRLAVRSADKGAYYTALFGHYPARAFEPIVVPDVQAAHAYDHAVQGVHAVVHTASPMKGAPGVSPQEAFIAPAVKGTANLLHAVAQHGADVRRVVLTSTIAAAGPLDAPGQESDWNETALAAYEKDPLGPARMNAYIASKILAERAAWEWFAKEADQGKVDLVTILPSWVFGPFIHAVKAADQVPSGVAFHRMLFDGKVREKDYWTPRHGCVDVRDVAELHLKALEVDEAGGHRFAAQARTWVWQDLADAVHASPGASEEIKRRVALGRPGSGKDVKQAQVDASRSEQVLGITYRSTEAIVDGELVSLADAKSRGWTGRPGSQVRALL